MSSFNRYDVLDIEGEEILFRSDSKLPKKQKTPVFKDDKSISEKIKKQDKPVSHHFLINSQSDLRCDLCQIEDEIEEERLKSIVCLNCCKNPEKGRVCHRCHLCKECGPENCSIRKTPIPLRDEVDMVIFHQSCPDGFGAAWCAWKLLGDQARYIPARPGDIPPPVNGKNIIVVDYCYNKKSTQSIIKGAKSVLVLDHHKSNMIDLNGLSNTYFDLSRSAIRISWNYFHPGKQPPKFVNYIEDKDLWLWRDPDSRAFSANLESIPFVFSEYDKFCDEKYTSKFVKKGRIIDEYLDSLISKTITKSSERKFQGYNILVFNSAHFVSEIGNKLAGVRDVDFSMIWRYDHKEGCSYVSLRADRDDIDLSAIAKKFRGGGHPKAAAFKWNRPIEDLFDQNQNKR